MSEKSLWVTFRKNITKHFGPQVSLQRHEDLCSDGIPDVSYAVRIGWNDYRCGWIELKYTPLYPVRTRSPVRLTHFTLAQRAWLHRRGTLGERCVVLWQIHRDYYVFNWQSVNDLGQMTKTELRSIAYWYCKGSPNWSKLMTAIAGG